MIVTVPACKIVIVDSKTFAIPEFELSYENAPSLLDVGGVNINVPQFEYVRGAIVKPAIVGVGMVLVDIILNVAVVLPAV